MFWNVRCPHATARVEAGKKGRDEMGTAAGTPMACGCRQELKLEPWESLSGFVWAWPMGTAGPVGVWHGDPVALLWRLCRKITLES